MVQVMSELFKTHPKLVMLVTPEATRAKQEQWKTGFIMSPSMPVCQLHWPIWTMPRKNWCRKNCLSDGDYEKDMAEIMAFYADIEPKFPECFSVDQRYYQS